MQPITADPLHLPQLTGSMKHYLWILKITHGGADLDGTLEMAKGALDGDLQCVPAPLGSVIYCGSVPRLQMAKGALDPDLQCVIWGGCNLKV